jgi:mono/diheme cytochrome c family protein
MQNSTGESMKRFFTFAIVATMAMPLFAADGAAIFKAKCAMCHGADGAKAMPAMGVKPLNTPATKGKTEAALIATVTNGQGKMPAFAGKLSNDEIKAAVTFVKSLK